MAEEKRSRPPKKKPDRVPRQAMPVRPAEERVQDFQEDLIQNGPSIKALLNLETLPRKAGLEMLENFGNSGLACIQNL